MATKKKHTVPFKRKLQGKTDYKKRLFSLMSGKPRVVIRKSSKNMQIQMVQYHQDGDKVLFTVHTGELKKLGWKYNLGNIPSAYLAGMLAAKKAKEHNVQEAVVDLGLQTSVMGNRLFAAVKGLVDGGLNVPCSEESFPKPERLAGKHIESYVKQFSGIDKDIEAMKSKIKG